MRIFGILKTFSLVVLPLLLISCSSDSKEEPSEVDGEVLKEQVLREKADFDIGAAVTTSGLRDPDYKEVLSTHYSKIMAEFEMKMSHVWESPDSYNWAAADALVEFAKDHDMKVHGHTLIW